MVENEPSKAAGGYAQLMAKESRYCQVKMPSGEIRLFHARCRASIGQISHTDHENIVIGKAGRNRWLGVRPTNRGVSMNPIDHPHGGGEGKASLKGVDIPERLGVFLRKGIKLGIRNALSRLL